MVPRREVGDSGFATMNWVDVTNTVNLIGNENQATIPTSTSKKYCHLKYH